MVLNFKHPIRLALLACVCMLSACLPEPLSVEGVPQVKPKLVISSQVLPDQSVLILVTKSVGALEANDDSDPQELIRQVAVLDASLTLTHGALTYSFTSLGNGLYTSGEIDLEAGDEYSLTVVSPSVGSITASTTVMPQVSFEFIQARLYNTGYDTLAEVSYGFVDPAGKNYYMMNVQRLTREAEPDELLNPEIFTELLEDTGFDGEQYFNRQLVVARRDFMPGDTLGIFLSNISEEYYEFMKMRLDSRFNLSDFLGEPANYPTNITGGLCFFNLYIPDVRILELEQ